MYVLLVNENGGINQTESASIWTCRLCGCQHYTPVYLNLFAGDQEHGLVSTIHRCVLLQFLLYLLFRQIMTGPMCVHLVFSVHIPSRTFGVTFARLFSGCSTLKSGSKTSCRQACAKRAHQSWRSCSTLSTAVRTRKRCSPCSTEWSSAPPPSKVRL